MKKLLPIILSVALLLSACSTASAASYDAQLTKQDIEPLDAGFVSGVNSFGISAASKLYSTDANLALSPVSIELALSMARTGASGATKDEMTDALGLSSLSDGQITQACQSLMWRANTGGMEAANALWLLKDYKYKDDYIKTCTEKYMADLKPLDIPGAMDAVNAWAKEKTHGRIDKILSEEPNADARMIITNALYYLGDWDLPFDANDTYDDNFAAPGGGATASFMHSEWSVPYYANDQFSMITLKFKAKDDEGKYAMAFILPAEGSSVDALLKSLNGDTFKAALGDAKDDQQVSISLPKFEFSYFAALADTLKSMGMEKAFSIDDADFSGITDADQLYISSVLHKCYVRVDELGAEAAAVTSVEMSATAMPMEPPLTFNASRPFLFAIYSQEDGAIAFIGAVNDPSQK